MVESSLEDINGIKNKKHSIGMIIVADGKIFFEMEHVNISI